MVTKPLSISPRLPGVIVGFLGAQKLIASPQLTPATLEEARTLLTTQPTRVVDTLAALSDTPKRPEMRCVFAIEVLNDGIFGSTRIEMPAPLRKPYHRATSDDPTIATAGQYLTYLAALLDPDTAPEKLAAMAAIRSGTALIRVPEEDDDLAIEVGGKIIAPTIADGVTQGDKRRRLATSTGPIEMAPQPVAKAKEHVETVLTRLVRRREIDEQSAAALKAIVGLIIDGRVEGMTTTDRQRVVNKLSVDTHNAEGYVVDLYTENAYGGTLDSEEWVMIPAKDAAAVGATYRSLDKPTPEIGTRVVRSATVGSAHAAYQTAMSAYAAMHSAWAVMSDENREIIRTANPQLFGNETEGDGVERGGIGRIEARKAALQNACSELESPALLTRTLRVFGQAGIFPRWPRPVNARSTADIKEQISQLVDQAERTLRLSATRSEDATATAAAKAFFNRVISNQPAGAATVKQDLRDAKEQLAGTPGLLAAFVESPGDALVAAIEETAEGQPTHATALARFTTYAEALERDAKFIAHALQRLQEVARTQGTDMLAATAHNLPGIGEIETRFALGAPVPDEEGIYGLLVVRGLPAPESASRRQLPKAR